MEQKQRNAIGDLIQEVEEGDATAEKVPNVYEKLLNRQPLASHVVMH